jgi:photosystem II stability/assembly factor-like uncharacterized protein
MFCFTSAHAQWDTIKTYVDYYNGERMNDIFFVSNTGYAVGHQPNLSAFDGQFAVISKTTDGGLTWNTTTLPMIVGSDTIFDLRSVYFTSPTTGYVAATCVTQGNYSFHFGSVLKTTDGGLTWTNILSTKSQINFINGTSIVFNSVQFTSQYSGYVTAAIENYLYSSGIIYYTTNAGVNWNSTVAYTGSTGSSSYFNSSGIGIMAGGYGTMENSNWIDQNQEWYSEFFYPGQISRTTNGGSTWSSVYSDVNTFFTDVHFPSAQTGYVCGYNYPNAEILKTTDGGLTWNVISTFPNLKPRCIYFTNDTTGYVGGWNTVSTSAIFKTIDGGLSWTAETDQSSNPVNARIVSLTATTPQTIYALNDSATATTTSYSSSSILGDFPSSSCAVFLGPDTTFCQTQGQLFATPATPSNDYVYSWSPGTGLSDSTAQNPFVNHVYNQQYVVTMTNTVTLCSATDTIVVTAYESVWGPQYICSTLGDSTLLDLGPGATNYQWQFYQDTAGNSTFLGNLNQQTYWATQQGHYLAIAFSSCGALTSYIEVDDTCGTYAWVSNVWPGDCNYDLTANAADALNIGLGYGTTGATRPSANNSWTAQPMSDWSQNFVTCNYKHADANGDGTIDANDTLPITLNYGLTHPYRLSQPVHDASIPDIYLVANYDTVGVQTLVTVDVRLGTAAMPIDSLYGISFRITADANLIDTTLTIIDPTTTWLGNATNSFNFRKYFRSAGSVATAECKKDHNNHLGGNGSIATFRIVTTDNVSGIQVCHFTISEVKAVTVSEHELTFNMIGDSVVIDPAHPAGVQESQVSSFKFGVYPNPASSEININSSVAVDEIQITDMLGQVLISEKPMNTVTNVNTSSLPNGTYFIRVRKGNTINTQKLVITR